jgi:hypothetical protein
MAELADVYRLRAWRARAEELRAMAGAVSDGRASADLLRLAEQWDSMARRLESQLPADLTRKAEQHPYGTAAPKDRG